MLFRISVSIITGLLIWSNSFAVDCKTEKECKLIEKNKETISQVEKTYKHLKERKINIQKEKIVPDGTTLKKVEKYKSLTKNREDVSKYQELDKAVNWKALFDVYGSNWLEMNEKIGKMLNPEGKKSRRMIFYLFSTTVPKETIINVFKSAKKYKDIEFYGVIRGLNRKGKKPVEKFIWKFLNDINEKVGGGITVKVNPIIFRKVDADVVPAFVLADCPVISGIIRSKECDYKAVIFGDFSLDFAVEKFKEAGVWDE